MLDAVIVDDEALARKIIKEYLEDFPQVRVVAECTTGSEAVRVINELEPDLVFLDVRMPGMDGFEVLEQLGRVPHIILSTAYSDFAVRAFEVHAVDYLLKPYDRQRFAKALERVLKSESQESERLDRLMGLLRQMNMEVRHPERIFVRVGNKIVAVNLREVSCIEAEGDYARLHTAKGSFLCSVGLGVLAERLDPASFLRVHRSTIVSKSAVERLEGDGEGGFIATLKDGRQVRVSRSYARRVKELIW